MVGGHLTITEKGTALVLLAIAIAAASAVTVDAWARAEEELQAYIGQLRTGVVTDATSRPRRYIRWRLWLQPTFCQEFANMHSQVAHDHVRSITRLISKDVRLAWVRWNTAWPTISFIMMSQPEAARHEFARLVALVAALCCHSEHQLHTDEVSTFIKRCDAWVFEIQDLRKCDFITPQDIDELIPSVLDRCDEFRDRGRPDIMLLKEWILERFSDRRPPSPEPEIDYASTLEPEEEHGYE